MVLLLEVVIRSLFFFGLQWAAVKGLHALLSPDYTGYSWAPLFVLNIIMAMEWWQKRQARKSVYSTDGRAHKSWHGPLALLSAEVALVLLAYNALMPSLIGWVVVAGLVIVGVLLLLWEMRTPFPEDAVDTL